MEGIIPARAGFTMRIRMISFLPGDHPRSRGVYLIKAFADADWLGSSPLARGLLDADLGAGAPGRIIPARAGFTP